MNKNLKKVISAVAALSVTASSMAAFAVNFPDVEDTASYAQAVQELSALDIISGYDDGTFGPDKLVTRAEISKMIVDALAEGNEAAASSSASKFDDVKDHWATGYINQGVADGWIAGHSDTEFAPDDKVTYLQAQKMLVAAAGYDAYAQSRGGWPAGYKLYASQLDITNGVQGVTSDDQQLTRAQVAQMIDNAMDAPLCKIEEFKTEWNGTRTPVYDVKDGEGKEYQTLFTEKHDAYKVFGRVTATSRTTTGLDTDKVMFKVEKADNFDDEYVKATDDRGADEMFYGDTNAESMLLTYAQALVQKNDDDEYTIISISPAAANKSVDLLASDVDDSKSDVDGKVLYFFPTGTSRGSVKYQLADEVKYFVNGVEATWTAEAFESDIVNNDTAMVTLMKETNTGSTNASSKYNVIMVTTFATAVVDQVVDKADTTTINFKEQDTNIKAKMTLEKDDDTKKYSFTLNGEAIDPAELQAFDVLSISYDTADFANSDFYDVKVARNTAEGKYTGKNAAGDEFTIGGTKYKAAYPAGQNKLGFDTSTEYTLYLDEFGRIAYADEISDSKKIGILKNVYTKNNGDGVAEIIGKDGKVIEYSIDDDDIAAYEALVKDVEAIAAYPEQVVEYKTTSSGKLTIKSVDKDENVATMEAEKVALNDEYKANSSKIGSIKISDATTIIDISNVSKKKDDIKVISKDSLKDGSSYTAYGYDKSKSDSTYRFVLITDGTAGINSTSQLSVFVEAGTDTDEDGNDVDTMTVLNNGEKVTLFVDEDSDVDVTDFAEGAAIIYSTNSAGKVDEVLSVFANPGLVNGYESFDNFKQGVFQIVGGGINTDTDWVEKLSDGDEDNVEVKAGVVVKSGNGYALATPEYEDEKVKVDLDSALDLDVSNAKIYTYNYSNNKKNAGRLELDNGMSATPDYTAAYEGGDNSNNTYYISHEDVADDVVYAFVRTFDDDEVQEIYLVYAD